MDFKASVAALLKKELNHDVLELLEVPPDPSLGDFAFPCFSLAKELQKSPNQIAQELSRCLKAPFLERIEVKGAYLNFFVKKDQLTHDVLSLVLKQKEKYGSDTPKKELLMLESPGPNTNKPLHLGHARNMILGNALVNLSRFLGYKVLRVDIVNDRGVHICKSMLAYQKFGKGKQPNRKSDHFVGDFYVKYSQEAEKNPLLEKEIYKMLQQWEEGNKEVRALWKKMNGWALQGFEETYARYGTTIDKAYFESDHYEKGKTIVDDGLKKNIFAKDEKGNIICDLTQEGLGKKVVLRADGTSIYITQDLALAVLRYKEKKMDKMIYVVANEQIHHFKSLFAILEKLGYPFAKNCYHLAYGMVYLPEGKMKSREGNVVDADDLADEMFTMAVAELKRRYKHISQKELSARAEAIGIGAVKFYMLKYDALQDFTYDPKASISFEGETGPYLQYTHARLCSILRKAGKGTDEIDHNLFDKDEHELIKQLGRFGDAVRDAAKQYRPHILARYLLDLGQAVNSYYTTHLVLHENRKLAAARLALITAVKTVLATGLRLLGILPLEEM